MHPYISGFEADECPLISIVYSRQDVHRWKDEPKMHCGGIPMGGVLTLERRLRKARHRQAHTRQVLLICRLLACLVTSMLQIGMNIRDVLTNQRQCDMCYVPTAWVEVCGAVSRKVCAGSSRSALDLWAKYGLWELKQTDGSSATLDFQR